MLDVTKQGLRDMLLKQISDLDLLGKYRYGEGVSRCISIRQEAAYRLCHQDFFGMPIADAAEVLDTTERNVRSLLDTLRLEAPQLFPILTPRAARIYSLFMDNFTTREIAETMGRSLRSVQSVLRTLRRKAKEIGLYFPPGITQRMSFGAWMEEEDGIKEWY
jgi:DNA-binding CsgD family transcriptional regulator